MKTKLVFAQIILVLTFLSVASSSVFAQQVWARVIEFEGKVWIEDIQVKVGSKARLGEKFRTGENSKVILKLRDGSVLQLRSKSALVLSNDKSPGTLDLLVGKLLAVFSEGEHEVYTPTAVAGVRGTGLYLMVESPETTYACVCFGTVDFTAIADSLVKTTLTADHHSAMRLTEKDGKASISLAGMEDHSDDEVKHLQAMLDEPFRKWKWWK
jgi:hypothetical protein